MALQDVVSAVYGVTSDWRERAAMLFACGAESGCQSIQNMGGAPAYGPWQIYLPYHPGVTVSQANDPGFAAPYMYQHRDVPGCTSAQGDLWNTDPKTAALNAARCIEGATAAEPYSAAQINQGWQMAQQFANNTGATGGTIGGVSTGNPIVNLVKGAAGTIIGAATNPIAAPLGMVNKLLSTLFSSTWWVRALLILGGAIFIIIGVTNLTHLDEAAKTVAPIAAAAA